MPSVGLDSAFYLGFSRRKNTKLVAINHNFQYEEEAIDFQLAT